MREKASLPNTNQRVFDCNRFLYFKKNNLTTLRTRTRFITLHTQPYVQRARLRFGAGNDIIICSSAARSWSQA